MKKFTIIVILALNILFIGCGGEDTTVTATTNTLEDTTSSTQITVYADTIAQNSIEIYWDAQSDVNNYLLEYGEKSMGLVDSVTLDASTTRYKFDNLDSDTTYLIRLTTIFQDNTQNVSSTLEIKTDTINKIIKSDIALIP